MMEEIRVENKILKTAVDSLKDTTERLRYFRSGAPPVINPLHTRFPRDTIVPGSFAVTLTWTLPNRTTGVFNVTSPLPGDWFLAAHLPKDEGKISVKRVTHICWPAAALRMAGSQIERWMERLHRAEMPACHP
ncbi:unnamed protein product [Coregonus sp. 'balchen']|nr:unnamed protein product [Coregonus sp. 'balchen']